MAWTGLEEIRERVLMIINMGVVKERVGKTSRGTLRFLIRGVKGMVVPHPGIDKET